MTDELDDAATGAGLNPAFQQVVSLPEETVVGYEALARWPALQPTTPLEVFRHAERKGTLALLDRACVLSAVREALDGGTDGMLLLLNSEPATPHIDPRTDDAVAEAAEKFHLVFELTERRLLSNPQALLRKVAALRSLGFAIALDDIGAHRDSLALLDIVAPDVLKLDLGVIQRQADQHQAHTVAAVIAHHERTGATILAEGIETDAHLEQALAYGATLGQGYRFGQPGALTAPAHEYALPRSPAGTWKPCARSVFESLAPGLTPRVVRTHTLLELSRYIERLALTADSPPIVLVTVQDYAHFRSTTRAMYTALSGRSPLVAVFGRNVPDELDAGVRGVPLTADDPLTREWTVVVLGTDNSAALSARELAPTVAADAQDRRFEVVITFDRTRVARAARSLLDRVPAITERYSAAAAR